MKSLGTVLAFSGPAPSYLPLRYTDEALVRLLHDRVPFGLSAIYDQHVRPLYAYACGVCRDTDKSEAIIERLFKLLWSHPPTLPITGSLRHYLLRETRALCNAEHCAAHVENETVQALGIPSASLRRDKLKSAAADYT